MESKTRTYDAMTICNAVLALALLWFGWAANQSGIFFNALFIFILLSTPLRLFATLKNASKGSIQYSFWHNPFSSESLKYTLQSINGLLFWIIALMILQICIVPTQFTPEEYGRIRMMVWGSALTLICLQLLSAKRVYVATNLVFTVGWVFMAVQLVHISRHVSQEEATILSAPFHGEWVVVQGGRSSLINHHYRLSSQRNALDLNRIVQGKERVGDRNRLESHPAWNSVLYAPLQGKIAFVVNDREDNPIGQTDGKNPAGNYLSLDIGGGRYVLMAHLKKGSVRVEVGDSVSVGQEIARCGNSGNTSQPHLHLQVQDRAQFFAPETRTYPILFRDVVCRRFNHQRTDSPFDVRRNDRIIRE
jgi:hypothetical protein